MPIRKLVELKICASSRVRPKLAELNGEVVSAGGGVPWASPNAHIPMTGAALLSLAVPLASNAITATPPPRSPPPARPPQPPPPPPPTDPHQSPPPPTAPH